MKEENENLMFEFNIQYKSLISHSRYIQEN